MVVSNFYFSLNTGFVKNILKKTTANLERIIGSYTGNKKGPLLICFGGIHGNEPAGIRALEELFERLKKEPLHNPAFEFNGRLLGIRGNLRAIQAGKRYLQKDLNRQWTKENIERITDTAPTLLKAEDLEIKEILALIQSELQTYQPSKLIVLDLHTTTAHGGIFTVVTDAPESIKIGIELHAPVIQGLLKSINGTTLHYFNTENFQIPTTAICFESGQHQEPLSITRAVSALINCLRTIGCVDPSHIETKHDEILQEYSNGLPKLTQLIKIHRIQSGDEFKMRPGYKNFQWLEKGSAIADDKNGPIIIEEDCFLLMPLYQNQGDDGFFLIREV